jgi:Arylsulfotransferase (ASST)
MSKPRVLSGAAIVLALAGIGGQRVLAHRGARPSAAGPAPNCIPAQLNASALLPGTPLTVSPLPGSLDASPYTQISLLGAPAGAISDVSVTGSATHDHAGRLEPYSQGDGASFLLKSPLAEGENVQVRGRVSVAGAIRSFSFSFTVARRDPIPYTKPTVKPAGKQGEVQTFRSQPGMRAPVVSVGASSPQQQQGDVFAAPYSGPGQDGPMIFDSTGTLVWFHPLASGTEATNLQEQQYRGAPVLSWWQGYIPPQGFGEGEEIVADSSYRTLFHVRAGNGYRTDLHDFHLTGSNTALFTVFDPIRCNLSSVGGPREAALTDGVFQEVDLATGLVRREWHSADHVSPSQSYSSGSDSTDEWPFDYFHINSVEPRADGSFLVSSRNTWALYLLDPRTGEVTAQIGGKHSTYKLGPGASTAYQHDAQELPDGELSIFDNGGVPMAHPQSRGIIVSLDPRSGTDTLITEYEHPAPMKSGSQGNVQLMENGDYFIGWGSEPYFSEFSPSGQLLFDAHLPHGTNSYRGYRFPWSATPAAPPSIAVGAAPGGAATVYASWNGATAVASWRVLGGNSPTGLAPLASAPKRGFETAIALGRPPAYVAVQALDARGEVLGTSGTVRG